MKGWVAVALCVLFFHQSAAAQDLCVNGSFEDAASPGDGFGGYYGWTDENGDVEIDREVWQLYEPNHGSHWLSLVDPDNPCHVDVSQYVTSLVPGNMYRADFAVCGGPGNLAGGVRWIPGNTTGSGNQRTSGTDGGTISETPGAWYPFGGVYFTPSQSDYTLYVYASQLNSGWTCGAGVHLDGDADGVSVEHVNSVVDWALY